MKSILSNKFIGAALITAFILLMGPGQSQAAFEFQERGGRSTALGGAYTAVSDDIEAIWWNPAGLRLVRNIQVDTSYTSLYGMGDLGQMNFAAVIPTMNLGSWAFGFSSFGFSDYKETDLRLSFSSALQDGIYFGTNLKSSGIKIGNDGGSGGVFAMDVGFLGNVSENFSIGGVAYNINRPKLLSSPPEDLEQRYMVGLYATPIDGVAVSFDMHKVPDKDWEQRIGLEFPLASNFLLRTGMQTRPARLSLGFGANIGIFSLNYAFRNHHTLDAQHLFALQARFGAATQPRVRVVAEEYVEEDEVEPEIMININTANVDELSAIPGLGPTVSGRIVEYRDKTGDFRSVRDIMRVPGVTRNMYSSFRNYMTVDGETVIEEVSYRWGRPDYGYSDAMEELHLQEEEEALTEEKVEVEPEIEPEPLPVSEPEPEAKPVVEPEPESVKKVEDTAPPAKININTADAASLRSAGIPAVLARNIVRYRDSRGYFSSWNDLNKVPGMQRSMLNKLRESAVIERVR